MKHSRLLAITLMLSACGTTAGPVELPLQERLRNPLVAERYWSAMAEHMADFTRTEDAIMKNAEKKEEIEEQRKRALERVDHARALKKEGISGLLQAVFPSEDAIGEVLLRGTVLSFGPEFSTKPNPEVRVYLTTAVDPRDVRFPDASALDLGPLQIAFGAQEYAFPQDKLNPSFFTAVLYDRSLKRIVGFAQLER